MLQFPIGRSQYWLTENMANEILALKIDGVFQGNWAQHQSITRESTQTGFMITFCKNHSHSFDTWKSSPSMYYCLNIINYLVPCVATNVGISDPCQSFGGHGVLCVVWSLRFYPLDAIPAVWLRFHRSHWEIQNVWQVVYLGLTAQVPGSSPGPICICFCLLGRRVAIYVPWPARSKRLSLLTVPRSTTRWFKATFTREIYFNLQRKCLVGWDHTRTAVTCKLTTDPHQANLSWTISWNKPPEFLTLSGWDGGKQQQAAL